MDERLTAESLAEDVRLLSAGPDPDGGFGIFLLTPKELSAFMVSSFRAVLDEHDPSPENYVEMKVHCDGETWAVIVVRPGGKTPHELRREAEARVADLTDRLTKAPT